MDRKVQCSNGAESVSADRVHNAERAEQLEWKMGADNRNNVAQCSRGGQQAQPEESKRSHHHGLGALLERAFASVGMHTELRPEPRAAEYHVHDQGDEEQQPRDLMEKISRKRIEHLYNDHQA